MTTLGSAQRFLPFTVLLSGMGIAIGCANGTASTGESDPLVATTFDAGTGDPNPPTSGDDDSTPTPPASDDAGSPSDDASAPPSDPIDAAPPPVAVDSAPPPVVIDSAPPPSTCSGYASPTTTAGCDAECSTHTDCTANGCYGAYWCQLSTLKCVAEPASCQ